MYASVDSEELVRGDTGHRYARDLERREFLTAGGMALAASTLSRTRDESMTEGAHADLTGQEAATDVAALTFDVFGTVVDWRTSIVREGRLLGLEKGIEADWEAFADRWRAGYGPAMNRVRTGELPWMKIDQLHRRILDGLVGEFGLAGLTDTELDDLNRVWHRLVPWPDSVLGLGRLRSKYVLATLSNGNVSLLTNMAKSAGLPWDCILSAELAERYKPDPEVYLKAADLLSLPPARVMMVAAHKGDLLAAQSVGFKTAFVPRPLEYGPGRSVDTAPDARFDVNATDFLDLAARI